MALPTSGLITLAMLAAEFGGSAPYSLSQYYRGGGLVTANNTNVPASGQISLSNFYGATKVVPGSISYTTPGTYNFTVPYYSTLTADCYGAGGGGGGISANGNLYVGGTGGYSYFNAPTGNVVGYGGGGGGGGDMYYGTRGANGASGTGVNGDGNVTGGGAGGGAGGAWNSFPQYNGGNGGTGGRAYKTWAAGALAPGSVVQVVVGQGGAAAAWESQYSASGHGPSAGGNGAVHLSWS